ncbi:DUF4097 domain-containing protein [Gordonia sp. TBRC 11910]|uniref:DUF4097 domain-containing protein n=1 Tax=Gordonia asplenii TaxID=2725283 RepID=A0A848KXL2_9ACTN|nr:DUF4097 family beta strand repeat-containing protein [Gordonia asplenii]NMO03494.1 DUF4097 domain-containing protein [Gordonia asplenii]
MPVFTLDLDLAVGDVHIIASDRTTPDVTITPQYPDRASSVRAAEQTTSTLLGDRLRVHNSTKWRLLPRLGAPDSVDIVIDVPAGTAVTGSVSAGSIRADGALGPVDLDVSYADVIVESTASLNLKSSTGAISARHVDTDVTINASYGAVRLGDVGGSTSIKNSYGNISVGTAAGPAQIRGAYGSIDIERALDSVSIKTAHGKASVRDVRRGTVSADSSFGEIEIGIHDGTAAYLDVESAHGRFHNELTPSTVPGSDDDTVAVRARTSYGDIFVTRTLTATPNLEKDLS